MYAFRVTGTTGTGEPTLFDDGAGKMAAQSGAAAGVKGRTRVGAAFVHA